MMRFLLLLIGVISSLTIYAYDIIVFRNGDVIRGIVREITTSEVKYNKSTNPNGPIYTVDKTTVVSINYENGETDKFDGPTESTNDIFPGRRPYDVSEGLVGLNTNTENDSILLLYKNCKWERLKELGGKKKSRKCETYWAFANGTILCNDDLEISFESEMVYVGDYHPYSNRIRIRNKTNSSLYVDLANSFRICEGVASPFYDSNSYSTGNNGGNSISLGLGVVTSVLGIGGPIGTLASGIGVGSGKGSSASVTFQMERILTIPPLSSILMPGRKTVRGKEIITYFERIPDNYEAVLQDNDEVFQNEADYIKDGVKQGFYITYSKKPDFSQYHIIPIILYPWRFSTGKWKVIEVTPWRLIKGDSFNWNDASFTDSENWDFMKNQIKH